jgi:carboxypeptidase C (cathepsin A)
MFQSARCRQLALAVTMVVLPVLAQGQSAVDEAVRVPRQFVTQHRTTIHGVAVAYTASVEESFSVDDKGLRLASVISTSYVRSDIQDASERPVIFAFNGGPGSSSIWLHMGFLGPQRVAYQDRASTDEVHPKTTPPFQLVNNDDSPLDVADIVLFDPPGTGFSRVLPGVDDKLFYGVQQDANATVAFIKDWLQRHNRWNSPRFLMGESYGTIRAAVVSRLLAGGPMSTGKMDGLTLNGVILLGQAMGGGGEGDTRVLNELPTLAATAWYHGKVTREGRTLDQHVSEAQTFAANELARALFLGSGLPAAERERIAERVAALIGVSKSFVVEHDLRVSTRAFGQELLRTEGQAVGTYDSRFTLPLSPSGGDPVADDPAMGQYVPVYVGAFADYARRELGVTLDLPYNAIEFRSINMHWDYGSGPGVAAERGNFADELAIAMRRNPEMRLFVGGGYFDMATDLGSAEYTVTHNGFDPRRVMFRAYASGHMPYIGAASREAVARDLRQFVKNGR